MIKFFFDTKIFLYALSTDKDEMKKQKIALNQILNGDMEWINSFLCYLCLTIDKDMRHDATYDGVRVVNPFVGV